MNLICALQRAARKMKRRSSSKANCISARCNKYVIGLCFVYTNEFMMQIVGEISASCALRCHIVFSSCREDRYRALLCIEPLVLKFWMLYGFQWKIVIQIMPTAYSCVPFSKAIISGILPFKDSVYFLNMKVLGIHLLKNWFQLSKCLEKLNSAQVWQRKIYGTHTLKIK